MIQGKLYAVGGFNTPGGGRLSTVEEFTPPTIVEPIGSPVIISITDVPNDQGKQVRIKWRASSNDGSNTNTATSYGIWRIDEPSVLTSVGTIPALSESVYSFVAPTLFDSTATGVMFSTFIVSMHTADPLIFVKSEPDSGYSVDNLIPSTPTQLSLRILANAIKLDWASSPDKDFRFFAIYRSTTSGFTPSNLADTIGTTIDTTFTDNTAALNVTYYYRISAFDFSGNQSLLSEEVIGSSTGVEEVEQGRVPSKFELSQNYPNPFNPTTRIAYDVPQPAHVTLVVYNLLGQEVIRLVDTQQTPGRYVVTWDGRNAHGQSVASGVYLYRLTTSTGFSQTRRMTLVK